MTVAELGLKIQSGDATVASRNLDAMTQAGGRAEQQFRALEVTSRRAMLTVGQTVSGPLKAMNDNLRAIAGAGSGGGSPFATILAGLTALPIPASAAAVAFGAVTTAAGYLVSKLTGDLPFADDALTEHARLIGIVKDAYKNAANKAGEFLEHSRAITKFQTEQNLIQLESQLTARGRAVVGGMSTNRNNGLSDMGGIPADTPMAMQGGVDTNQNVKAFTDLVEGMNRELETGAVPNIAKFREGLAEIGSAAAATNPALAKQANELLKNTQGEADLALAIEKTQASLAQLNGTATDHQKKLLGIRDEKAKVVKETGEERDAYDRMLETIQKRNEKAEIELATLGMTAGATAAYRVQQELLNAAKRAEIELTPAQIEQNKALAESAAHVAEKLEMARGPLASYIRESSNLNKGLQTVAVDGLRGVENALIDISNGTTTAAEAFRKMTASILEDLGRMLIKAAVARAAGLFLGGGGGVSTYSGVGNPWSAGGMVASANGNVFRGGNVIPFAKGGVVSVPTLFPMANGTGLMGEAGPEAVMPLRRGADGKLGVAASGGGGDVHVTVGVSVDQNGNLQAYVKDVARGEGAAAARQFAGTDEFKGRAASATAEFRGRRITR